MGASLMLLHFSGKKGIMITMLLAILAAILFVLVPSCLFASKFFTLTQRASQNFVEFTELIEEVNELPIGSKKTFVFIQDRKTYIYPIYSATRDSQITSLGKETVDFHLGYTAECSNQNCYCLCREYKDKVDRSCTNLLCQPLPKVSFSQGIDVIINRDDEEEPRRQQVTIIRCKAGDEYCKLSRDGEISIIFESRKGTYGNIK